MEGGPGLETRLSKLSSTQNLDKLTSSYIKCDWHSDEFQYIRILLGCASYVEPGLTPEIGSQCQFFLLSFRLCNVDDRWQSKFKLSSSLKEIFGKLSYENNFKETISLYFCFVIALLSLVYGFCVFRGWTIKDPENLSGFPCETKKRIAWSSSYQLYVLMEITSTT